MMLAKFITATTLSVALSAAIASAQVGVPGGWSPADIKELEPTLLKAMTQKHHKGDYNSDLKLRVCVAEVVSVEQQVVAGMNYRFHVHGCEVPSAKRAGWCKGNDANCETQTYAITVFEQSWTNTLQISDIVADAGATESKKDEKAKLVVEVHVDDGDNDESSEEEGKGISESEKKEIDAWIKAEGRNEFGDKKGTHYTGGTPLFDENTGTRIDVYKYILLKHPDRPWHADAAPAKVKTLTLAAAAAGGVADRHRDIATIFGVFGTLTVVMAVVALAKTRQSRQRFSYDTVSSREY